MGDIQRRKDRRGKVTYTARIRRKGFKPLCATFDRRTDAQEWLVQEEKKVRAGLRLDEIEAEKHTLAEAIERYTQEQGRLDDNRRVQLQRWKKALGPRYLSAITDIAINGFISDLRRSSRFAPATLNRHLDSLSVVMKAAKRWGWIRRNPVADAERQSEPKGIVRYLTDEERDRLLEACKQSEYKPLYLIVVLALSTGMRKEEILSLRWCNVDLAAGIIILQKTKNKERRRVPVRGLALELLRNHAKVRRLGTDFLFPGEKPSPDKECVKVPANDRHFSITAPWERARKLADLHALKNERGDVIRQAFRFHDLRHSCASYLAMGGASLLEIAEVLGHKTLEVAKRYSHLSESHTAGVVERMNRRVFGESKM